MMAAAAAHVRQLKNHKSRTFITSIILLAHAAEQGRAGHGQGAWLSEEYSRLSKLLPEIKKKPGGV